MGKILRGNMAVRLVRRLEIKGGVGDTSGLAMVALFVPPEVTDRLYVPGGEEPAKMHVTLAYLGEIDKISDPAAVRRVVQDLARQTPPLRGLINGIGRFIQTHKDGMHAVYASPDLPGLPELRQALVEQLAVAGVPQQSEHGFVPHITLNYVAADSPTPAALTEPVPVEFTALSIEWGGQRTDYPLVGGETEVKGGPGSGNWGHAGRKGKRGGSMSKGKAMSLRTGKDAAARQAAARAKGKGEAVSMIDKETGIDLNDPNALGTFNIQHRAKLEAGLRQDVAALLADYAKEKGWDDDQLNMAVDFMLLDKDSFEKYGGRFGIDDAAEKSGKFMERQRDIDRETAKDKFAFQDRNTAQVTLDDGRVVARQHTSLSPELNQLAESKLVGEDHTEAARALKERFNVDFHNNSQTPDDEVHQQLSWLLNVAEANPAVGNVLREKTDRIWYDDPKNNETKVAEWIDADRSGIRVVNSEYMGAATWVHELGHGAEQYYPNVGVGPGTVGGTFDREKRVSGYAWGNHSEDFAETFTAMVGGGYDQTWLRQNMPNKYQSMIDNVPGVKEAIGDAN